MRETKPSFTARRVAVTRATLVRPELATGDADAEVRLYRSLGGRRVSLGDRRLRRHLAVRTAFFDRETLQAIGDGVRQVVIVGAGYDGRALRFASPEVRWFEVDHPATQADKRARLAAVDAPSVQTAFVAVDLVRDDLVAALRRAGFDAARSSLFVVEGLLGYLPRAVTSDLLRQLRDLASSASRLAVAFPTRRPDAPAPERLQRRVRGLVVAALGEPWLSRFEPDEPEQLLRSARWAVALDDDRPVRYQGRNGVLISAEPATAGAA
ncbi:MAG TPA: SAM-dependent methyltransferase [Acidimicrobiales bacterium]|nr:SAM-dependent methyltransferase [Acidimicrobiales bacterium]